MIKAIDTYYNGYYFRSRTEARWAVFFDAMGIKYEYEKEGFELPCGNYLPDFWLPNFEGGSFVEIKGNSFTDNERIKCRQLAEMTLKNVLMLNGPPDFEEYLYYDCTTYPFCPLCDIARERFSDQESGKLNYKALAEAWFDYTNILRSNHNHACQSFDEAKLQINGQANFEVYVESYLNAKFIEQEKKNVIRFMVERIGLQSLQLTIVVDRHYVEADLSESKNSFALLCRESIFPGNDFKCSQKYKYRIEEYSGIISSKLIGFGERMYVNSCMSGESDFSGWNPYVQAIYKSRSARFEFQNQNI